MTTSQLKVAFAYALSDLLREMETDRGDPQWQWVSELLAARKIPGDYRYVQDRFARLYNQLHLSGDHIAYLGIRDGIFSSWTYWG